MKKEEEDSRFPTFGCPQNTPVRGKGLNPPWTPKRESFKFFGLTQTDESKNLEETVSRGFNAREARGDREEKKNT